MKLNNKINCTNNSQWITFTYSQAFSTASVYTYLKIVLLILQFLVLTLVSFLQRNKPRSLRGFLLMAVQLSTSTFFTYCLMI